MTITQTDEPIPRKPLRLWPGVAAVVLLWVARFGIKAVVPGFQGFARGMVGGIFGALAVVVWWAFFSRAPRTERVGALVLIATALGATWLIKHESMGPLWLIGYAIPVLCLAFVAWAVASRRLTGGLRWATMAATILLSCGVWTLVRTDGVNGDHVAKFGWRWAASPEERLLALTGSEPGALPPAAAAAETPRKPLAAEARAEPPALPSANAADETSKEPLAVRTGDATAALSSAPAAATNGADWPGFRGPGRDGIVRGVRIETNWSQSPPIQLWRRPLGPGWSSFAVSGDLLYTQEQRGDDEVVACSKVTTGEPVWTHRDATRFFESNGGVGPRATPTVSKGHVYTFGATGILNVLDAVNGAVVWSRDVASDTGTGIPPWGFASSPLVVGELVIVAAAGQLAAYDRARGVRRWLGPAGGDSYSSPHWLTIDGVPQILLMNGAGATSVSPADGKPLWQHKWPGFSIVQPAVIGDGDILISASTGGGTRRITVAHGPGGWTADERWTSNGLKPYFNDFVVHKGHAFGFDGNILACIDLEDGRRTWKGGRYGNGQLILLPDVDLLLVLSEEGELALVEATPGHFSEVARFPALEGKTWNHPVLVGDKLLVRNDHEMVAFRLSLASR